MVRQITRSIASSAIYVSAFIIGCVLMGFEMLGSRYLFPYFGGGVGTWAGLISMVLIALTIRAFLPVRRLAAWLMLPYFAWCLFAAYLNAGFWLLNHT